MCRLPVAEDGTLNTALLLRNLVGGSALDPQEQRRRAEELFLYVQPALLAVSFFHCKNVVIHVERPPELASRSHQKRYGRPLVKYRTLDIRPMRTVLRREGDLEHQGIETALHICRGHFKDFRQQGLFGRHKGIYWWGDQLRGHPRRGLVLKDYRVHPPEEDA